jgi:hypothetical protein
MSRPTTRRRLIAALAVCVVAAAGREGGSVSAAPPAAKPAPSAEQLAELVKQLDADEFLTRDTAMLALQQAGPAALPALKPVLAGGSLEATSRALYLLRQLGLAADFDTQEQAWEMLSELAARKETPSLANRAAQTLEELAQRRAAQALAELKSLGAKVAHSQAFGGLPIDDSALSIELGDGFRGEDSDLRRLKWLRDVPILILNGDKATDAWVKQAAAMPNLEELHLYKAKISETGLAPLAEHPKIDQIGIYYTPVGDKVLAPLVKLPLLNVVKLYGTKVTAQGEENFKTASGLNKIDRRSGAFLGVGGLASLDGTCLISTVHSGSPADKAGLMPEDTVVRFGQDKVTTFDSLQDLIAQREIGEEVEVEVQRRGFDDQMNQVVRNVVTKVQFIPWEVESAVRNLPRR